MAVTQIKQVDKKQVSCNGGKLGHPEVYLNMGMEDFVICPYCSKKFVLKLSCVNNS